MSGGRIYLDHNATAPLRPEARAAMVGAMDTLGNPSSVHGEGRKVRRLVEDARAQVARLVGVAPANVVFTSGATEANNWVVSAGWDRVFAAGVEHDSVLSPARGSTARFTEIAVDANGRARLDDLERAVCAQQEGSARNLLALQMANNETGVMQPIAQAAELCRKHRITLHCDGVQGAGRAAIDFSALGLDTLSLSSHKLGGPTGVGALIVGDGIDFAPLIAGGGQERRRRAGTENVVGIAGFGAAAQVAARDLADVEAMAMLRDVLERALLDMTPAAQIFGVDVQRIGNTTYIGVRGVLAETLLIKFDLAGVAVSSGAACSSGKVGTSHVLSAMKIDPQIARGAIRISLGWNTSRADVDAFLDVWRSVVLGQVSAVA